MSLSSQDASAPSCHGSDVRPTDEGGWACLTVDLRILNRLQASMTAETQNRREFMEISDDSDLTWRVIGCALEVHHRLGPGLLESIYEAALCHELSRAGIAFVRQRQLNVKYRGVELDCTFCLDLVVEGVLVLELKAVTPLLPIHEAQLLTYLRISGLPLGLLLNFNEVRLKDGIRRRALSGMPTRSIS